MSAFILMLLFMRLSIISGTKLAGNGVQMTVTLLKRKRKFLFMNNIENYGHI